MKNRHLTIQVPVFILSSLDEHSAREQVEQRQQISCDYFWTLPEMIYYSYNSFF